MHAAKILFFFLCFSLLLYRCVKRGVLNRLRLIRVHTLNKKLASDALSIHAPLHVAHRHLTSTESTYILVGTGGIPLHTWHALPCEAASVTLWLEGCYKSEEQRSQTLSHLPVEWKHMCIESMNWLGLSQFTPKSFLPISPFLLHFL